MDSQIDRPPIDNQTVDGKGSNLLTAAICGLLIGGVILFANWDRVSIAVFPDPASTAPSSDDLEREFRIAVRMAVGDRLRDPDSAKIEAIDIRHYNGGLIGCGEVNAKNGFGGYAGPRRFISTDRLAVLEGEPTPQMFSAQWAAACAPP